MTDSSRERFLGVCRFERPGELCLLTPLYFNGFWPETLENWARQGAPKQIINYRFRGEYFQFDHSRWLYEIKTSLDMNREMEIGGGNTYSYEIPPIVPTYEPQFLAEDNRTITLVNEGGVKVRVFKNEPDKMPTFLDWPVKDRATWEEYRKRLDPNTPERFPANWEDYAKKINSRNDPTLLLLGGFYGLPREWTGSEHILYMFYDDPKLIEDMMEQLCYMEIESIKKVIKDIRVDFVLFWEDMAFKTGPLISPDMVRKFMMPRYKKVTDVLRSNGIDVIFVDSDGNLNELIPLWIESGINGVWPLECAAGNDAVALRKKFGKDIILAGNIDKRALLHDKQAIHDEVMSKVPFLLEQGGYFPSVDHLVPPDVSFENYVYYINLLREIAGLEKLPK